MIKRETVEKVLRGPFSLEEYRFQRLLLLLFLLPPPFPLPGIDPIPIPIPRKCEKRASKHSRSNPQFRGFDDLRRGFRRKGLSAMSEGGGFQKRETRRLFRTEIGTTRSLRHSRTLECRYDEERTRHSSRIRPREEAKNRTEE